MSHAERVGTKVLEPKIAIVIKGLVQAPGQVNLDLLVSWYLFWGSKSNSSIHAINDIKLIHGI